MAGNISADVKSCEEKLSKLVDGKYSILENYFKEQKLKQKIAKFGEFEDAAKSARAGFASGRNAAAAVRADRELAALEQRFVKWYEGDEDIDDAPMFSAVVSFIREAREKLALYRAAVECLSAGNKEKSMEMLGKAFEKYKAAMQKACSLAAGGEERMADTADTLMRYVDLDHEAILVELMAPSGAKDPVERAISRMGGRHGSIMDLRAHAYHAKNAALQKAAMELLAASYEYQGALCAAYLFAEQN